jgi:ornithine cyclodeaminase
MLVLSNRNLQRLLTSAEMIAAVEQACIAVEEGRVVAPTRQRIAWGDNMLLTMPAVSAQGAGVKLVHVIPGNAARGMPVTRGVYVLNDSATGDVLATLNAEALTAQRTGAIAALAARHLAPAGLDSLGVVGCGTQGAWAVISICAVQPIRVVHCVPRSSAGFERFKATLAGHVPGIRIETYPQAAQMLRRTSLVLAATTSSTPVLPDEADLLAGKHFISMGSFRPDMQELPDAVYRLAGQVTVDAAAAREEVGDIAGPLQRGILQLTDVLTIGAVVTGRARVDLTLTTAFKSVGMAAFDLFAAHALYRAALAAGVGICVDLEE